MLDYLFRAAAEPAIALGDEPLRYYEFAAADAEALPADVDTELVGPGGILYSTPLLPQAPVGAEDTQAHLVVIRRELITPCGGRRYGRLLRSALGERAADRACDLRFVSLG